MDNLQLIMKILTEKLRTILHVWANTNSNVLLHILG